ncbi:MAG TPA: DUF4190 domain-containing protein [Mycobacteriales bacterium]|nr:DUF4190 domain-containing protein [Mycobacteriales bacterium]
MSDQGQPSWMPPPAPPPPQQGWYGQPGPYGYPRPRDTNGFAIASLVCSLLGIIFLLVGPILAIVFGVVGLKQIPRLGQGGRGLAIAGITIGAIVLLLDVIGLVAAFATASSVGGSGGVPV